MITFLGSATGDLYALKTITAMAPKEPIRSARCSLGRSRYECRTPRVLMPMNEPMKLNALYFHDTCGGLLSPRPDILDQKASPEPPHQNSG